MFEGLLDWKNQTGLAKAGAILATVLLISLGLCGLNFGAVMVSKGHASGFSAILAITGCIEALAIVLSAAGLVILLSIAILKVIARRISPPRIDGD